MFNENVKPGQMRYFLSFGPSSLLVVVVCAQRTRVLLPHILLPDNFSLIFWISARDAIASENNNLKLLFLLNRLTLVELYCLFGVILQILVHEDIFALINISQHLGVEKPL